MTSEMIERIIFLDLDNTLFNHSYIRGRASAQALSQLNLPWTKKCSAEIYRTLVTCYPVFKLLGMTNFRLNWNSPEIYYTLKTFAEMPPETRKRIYKDFIKLFQKFKLKYYGKMSDNAAIDVLIHHIVHDWGALGFGDTYITVQNNKDATADVHNAIRAFSHTMAHMKLAKNVKNLLHSLKQANIDSYIISEGYKEQQFQKIGILGLFSFFKEKNIFILEEKSIENYSLLLNEILGMKDRCIKLVVLGDRYDKDIFPFISLLGKQIYTIHLRSGKYRNCYSKEILAHRDLPLPDMTIRKFDEVRALLPEDGFWDSISPIGITSGRES